MIWGYPYFRKHPYILSRAFPSRIAIQAEFTGGFGTFPNLQAWKGIRLRAVSVGLPHPHGLGPRVLRCWSSATAALLTWVTGTRMVLKEIYSWRSVTIRCNPFNILSYPVYFKSLIGGKQAGWSSEKLLLLDFVGIAAIWIHSGQGFRSSEMTSLSCVVSMDQYDQSWPRLTISSRLHSIRTWSILLLAPSIFCHWGFFAQQGSQRTRWSTGMGLHEKTAEVFFCVLYLAIATDFWQNQLAVWSPFWIGSPWLQSIARLPLQTLRILHLPGNEISKLEDPISAMRGRHIGHSKPPSCGCKNDLHLHGRVLKVEFWD